MLTLIGRGRIGHALQQLAQDQQVEVCLLGRGEPVPSGGGPVVVCTRNDDVAGVIATCDRVDDLVFVQNGALLPWLRDRGLGHLTQGQLWFAVPAGGAPPAAGAESVFHGRHAPFLASLLQRAELPARVLRDEAELEIEVGVKLLWLSVFGLLGDRHRETVLASLARRTEVEALVGELLPVCAAGLGHAATLDATLPRLCAYSLAIGSWRAAVKEWRWRDGWLREVARTAGIPTPLHDEACERLGLGT